MAEGLVSGTEYVHIAHKDIAAHVTAHVTAHVNAPVSSKAKATFAHALNLNVDDWLSILVHHVFEKAV